MTDPAGYGIAGVAVKIERFGAEVDLILTNAAGNYTSDPLFRNVYVVTPRKSWYRFVPPSQTVPLVNNVSGIDFKGILREKRADFDGDGKTDISVFGRTSGNWAVRKSSDLGYDSFQFGLKGDILTPGDFDADGKTDAAVFRPSDLTWYIRRPVDGSFYGVQFGLATDLPVPGDYDGDGKADVAVKRNDGTWYVLKSTDGSVWQLNFTNEYPVPRAYLHPIYGTTN